MDERKADRYILIGMIILGISGVVLGTAIGYVGSKWYTNNRVLNEMVNDGYVVTKDATATAEDIIAGKSGYVNGQLITGTKETVDTSDADATARMIVKGKTAYVNGQLITGTMEITDGFSVYPGEAAKTINGGTYLDSRVVIYGDEDLKAENIKKGVLLFNIIGTYDPKAQKAEENKTDDNQGGATNE